MQTMTFTGEGMVRRGRNAAASVCILGLLAALGGCADGTATTSLSPTATATAAAPAPAATPAPAVAPATAAAAPAPADKPAKAAPEHLTRTQINEQCWLTPEINKIPDLDKRMKLVDKCVEQKTKAQGGT